MRQTVKTPNPIEKNRETLNYLDDRENTIINLNSTLSSNYMGNKRISKGSKAVFETRLPTAATESNPRVMSRSRRTETSSPFINK